eukprot:CAMPEP_0181316802 /NCGR_PEP_ID=MMETSP1101-20121128/16090_1 /TAXON_ID=46948 /ORGANISM="Rhodomonas abbreviata, Strain Caron Lab Isolate" /LENGTH=277 /DNA_ID=CAMNT_0023424075 /DNA_START=32 /DNA_END=862 /DNA_ORIENTATION=-
MRTTQICAVALIALSLFQFADAQDLKANCTADPTVAACANSMDFYDEMAVGMSVKMLCDMMPQMPSCQIQMMCIDGTITAPSAHCGNWNLLSGVCSTKNDEMMTGMTGCKDYIAFCVEGTAVESCSDPTKQGPVDLPTTEEANFAAIEYCGSNSGDEACAECSNLKCTDAFSILVSACKAEPTASYCTEFMKMCDGNEGLDALCKPSAVGEEEEAGVGRALPAVLLLLSLSLPAVAFAGGTGGEGEFQPHADNGRAASRVPVLRRDQRHSYGESVVG